MTMYKVLHPKDVNDRLHVSRKEGRRGLANTEDSIDALIQQLEDYKKKNTKGDSLQPPETTLRTR